MSRSKYDDSFPLRAEGLARNGLTDEAIAAALGISCSTYYSYRKTYPVFAAAIRRGKLPVDTKVENALLRQALGHTYRETHLEDIIDRKTGAVREEQKRRVVIKQVSPNVTAAIFWLKNRCPEKYRDKQDSAAPGEMHFTFDPQDKKL
ncbi:MAG: hypothetical protein PHQ27_08420 [Victivallales bacterium]|nr:hypothetical protein [Victivallales bacterium]